jgi:hypothetical protein
MDRQMISKVKTFLTKFGWYIAGVFLLALAVFALVLRRKPSPTDINPITQVIETVKLQIDKAELQATIETERARGAEQSKLDELESISQEPDSRKRRERLARLL